MLRSLQCPPEIAAVKRPERSKAGGEAAYPAGKKLPAWEVKKSVTSTPRDSSGKTICWDNSCWIGCPREVEGCPHSHELIKGVEDLHWSVLAQIYRRGGLANAPKIDPKEVDGRVAQLRAQARSEKAEKESNRAAGTAPADYRDVQYTALEQELSKTTQGANFSWLKDQRDGQPCRLGPREAEHPEAQKRAKVIKEVLLLDEVSKLSDEDDHLRAYVTARLAEGRVQEEPLKLETILANASNCGSRELAEWASGYLEPLCEEAVGPGGAPEVVISPVTTVGSGTAKGTATVLGTAWEFLDFGEGLELEEALGDSLGLINAKEERQCLALHVAAATIWQKRPDAA